MVMVQDDLPLAPLHPLAVRLLAARRSWPRGRPEGLETVTRIIHTCDRAALGVAWHAVLSRPRHFPPDPFAE